MNKELAKNIMKDLVVGVPFYFDGFTIVHTLLCTKNRKYTSTGVVRCGNLDTYSKDQGAIKAEGQARQAMMKALQNKPCNDNHQSYSIVATDNTKIYVGDNVVIASWKVAKKSSYYDKKEKTICGISKTGWDRCAIIKTKVSYILEGNHFSNNPPEKTYFLKGISFGFPVSLLTKLED